MKKEIALILLATLMLINAERTSEDVRSEVFHSGREFRYHYDLQTSSGYSPLISAQQAFSRMEADVQISFFDNEKAILRLERVDCAQWDGDASFTSDPQNMAQILPMRLFESNFKSESKYLQFSQHLNLPVEFSYLNGSVESIRFSKLDKPWSKNIKKAVLNLIQLNLNASLLDALKNGEVKKSFVQNEINIEGECETLYVINDQKMEHLTKTVNFNRCKRLSDVSLGFHMEDIDVKITKENHNLEEQNATVFPKERLDRSSTYRYQLNRNEKSNSSMQFGIQKVEVFSQYSLKSLKSETTEAMQTVVSSRLELLEIVDNQRNQEKNLDLSEQAESLLYNSEVESLEKQYIMYGDAKFNNRNSPYNLNYGRNSLEKMEKVQSYLQNIVAEFNQEGKNKAGIDTVIATDEFQRLIELLRMCSVDEIKQIERKITSLSRIVEDLFTDTLASAASRNTIKVLSELIQSEKMDDIKAIIGLKTLGRGNGLPAISDAQVDIVLELCNSNLLEKTSKAMLKQSCWLSFGSMVRELYEQKIKAKTIRTETPMKAFEQFSEEKFDSYKNVLVEKLRKAENLYEKILVLKTIGNAGLKSLFGELRDIISNNKEAPVVRITAIEATRHLRKSLKTTSKIQQLLLPIFVNADEEKSVRMAAIQMIMHGAEEMSAIKNIVDQIAFSINNENSEEIRDFVYSLMKSGAESPLPVEQNLVAYLINSLKLGELPKRQDMLQSSQNRRLSLYSQNINEGAFIDMSTIFSSGQATLSLGLDTYLNGQYKNDFIKVSLCQKNFKEFVNQLFEDFEETKEESGGKTKEENNKGLFAKTTQQLQSIFQSLKIKSRQETPDSVETYKSFAILSIRLNNMDIMILPIINSNNDNSIPNLQIKKVFSAIFNRQNTLNNQLELNNVMLLDSKIAYIPTSAGMPLKIRQESISIGQLKAGIKTEKIIEMNLKFKANFGIMYHQRMSLLQTPVHFSGVLSHRAVDTNLPIETDIRFSEIKDEKQQLRISFEIPQENIRLLSFKTLPITFTQAGEFASEKTFRIKTIHNKQLEDRQNELIYKIGEQFSLPVNAHGHYHFSTQMSSSEVFMALMTSENQIEVLFEPIINKSPKEIDFIMDVEVCKTNVVSPVSSLISKLEDYYKSFQTQFFTSPNEIEESDEKKMPMKSRLLAAEDGSSMVLKTQKYLNKLISENNFKDKIKFIMQTAGAETNYNAEIEYELICDNHVRICETIMKIKRSAIFSQEQFPWSLEAKIQTIFPEFVNQIEEINAEEKQKQTVVTIFSVNWGPSPVKETEESRKARQQICLNIQGRPSQRVLKEIENQGDLRLSKSSKEIQANYVSKYGSEFTPLINEYLIDAEYRITSKNNYILQQVLELLKTINYWNTKTKILKSNEESQLRMLKEDSEKLTDGKMQLSYVVDPITCEYVNISYQTAFEHVRINSYHLKKKIHLISLIRPEIKSLQQRQKSTVKEYISDVYSSYKKHSQCKIDSKNIETFDNVVYSVPMSKCYTVLAKDCSNEYQSKFAVLMKNVDVENMEGPQKKIKIITSKFVVEAELLNDKNLTIRINGGKISISDLNEEAVAPWKKDMNIQKDTNDREYLLVDDENVAVKFDGKTVKIQLTEDYKNVQCGLCGNYNSESNDEWRTNGNELTDDLKTLHRSYTLQDNEEECTENGQKIFYEDANNKFMQTTSNESTHEHKPVPQTVVLEFQNNICFSITPVPQCPKGYREVENERRKIFIKFTCLKRYDLKVKKLKAEIRRSGVATTKNFPIHVSDPIYLPKRCIQY